MLLKRKPTRKLQTGGSATASLPTYKPTQSDFSQYAGPDKEYLGLLKPKITTKGGGAGGGTVKTPKVKINLKDDPYAEALEKSLSKELLLPSSIKSQKAEFNRFSESFSKLNEETRAHVLAGNTNWTQMDYDNKAKEISVGFNSAVMPHIERARKLKSFRDKIEKQGNGSAATYQIGADGRVKLFVKDNESIEKNSKLQDDFAKTYNKLLAERPTDFMKAIQKAYQYKQSEMAKHPDYVVIDPSVYNNAYEKKYNGKSLGFANKYDTVTNNDLIDFLAEDVVDKTNDNRIFNYYMSLGENSISFGNVRSLMKKVISNVSGTDKKALSQRVTKAVKEAKEGYGATVASSKTLASNLQSVLAGAEGFEMLLDQQQNGLRYSLVASSYVDSRANMPMSELSKEQEKFLDNFRGTQEEKNAKKLEFINQNRMYKTRDAHVGYIAKAFDITTRESLKESILLGDSNVTRQIKKPSDALGMDAVKMKANVTDKLKHNQYNYTELTYKQKEGGKDSEGDAPEFTTLAAIYPITSKEYGAKDANNLNTGIARDLIESKNITLVGGENRTLQSIIDQINSKEELNMNLNTVTKLDLNTKILMLNLPVNETGDRANLRPITLNRSAFGVIQRLDEYSKTVIPELRQELKEAKGEDVNKILKKSNYKDLMIANAELEDTQFVPAAQMNFVVTIPADLDKEELEEYFGKGNFSVSTEIADQTTVTIKGMAPLTNSVLKGTEGSYKVMSKVLGSNVYKKMKQITK